MAEERLIVSVVNLALDYFTDDEYEIAFAEFGGFRRQIAEYVWSQARSHDCTVVDLLSGHGFLSAEIARLFPKSRIVATGLKSDADSFLQTKSTGRYPSNIWSNVQYVQCNITELPLRASSCDLVVNFLGLEDVLMTSGMQGLRALCDELARIVKSGSLAQISLAEYGNTPEEKIAEQVWRAIGLNAIFLTRDEYLKLFESRLFHLQNEFLLQMEKKMTGSQAKQELEFACRDTPLTFAQFGVTAIRFENLWDRFGSSIERIGMAYWNRIRVMVFERS